MGGNILSAITGGIGNDTTTITTTTGSNSGGIIGNATIGSTGTITYPSYPYYGGLQPQSTIYLPTENFNIKMRKCENGWLLSKNGKEYVVFKLEELIELLKD